MPPTIYFVQDINLHWGIFIVYQIFNYERLKYNSLQFK